MNTAMKMRRVLMMVLMCLCAIMLVTACQSEDSGNAGNGFVQMGNPLVTVGSVQEMEEKLGYPIPVLEKEVEAYIVLVIDGVADSGRIRYADGSDFVIKRGSGDVSGIYGGVPECEEVIDGISVSFLVMEEIHYAIWEKDGFAYSLTGGETLGDDVALLITGE